MKRAVYWSLVLLPVCLFTTSCRDRKGTDAIERRQDEIDFSTGSVKGKLLWNTSPIAPGEAINLYLFETGSIGQWSNESSYELQDVPTGAHTLGLHLNSCTESAASKIGDSSFVVAAGSTAVGDFELTSTAGRVAGTIHVNGVPLPSARIMIRRHNLPCSTDTFTNENGAFSRILSPGTYSANVFGESGLIGSPTFTVTLGQTTDIGSVDIQVGSVQGTIRWNGSPISGGEAINLFVSETDSVGQWSNDSSYFLRDVTVGAHTVGLYVNSCTESTGSKIGDSSFSVVTGSTITADFELAGTAGRVAGTIHVNGAPLQNARVMIRPNGLLCSTDTFTDENGVFSRILAPGTYVATAFGGSGVVTSLDFTVAIGNTTDLGNVDIPAGNVQGTIRWNGSPITAGEAANLYLSETDSIGQWSNESSYELHDVTPGAHTVGLHLNSCTELAGSKIGDRSFLVVAGSTTIADFDLTATTGRVLGTIRVNGAALKNARIMLRSGQLFCGTDAYTNEVGVFSRILNPGSYVADVLGTSGIIGSFTFNILVGETTNVDSATTPSCQPGACGNVKTHLEGGAATVGGLSLEFFEVGVAGNTTVVTSGSCSPCSQLPTGYELVGVHYWDLHTTASYSGPIEVCIHYDQNWIGVGTECPSPRPAPGLFPECDLRLAHDGGDGFKTLTGTLDPVNNIICGSTMSLSPFAIIAPKPGANTPPTVTVPGSMIAEATGPRGTAVTFAASASDAQDSGLAPSCSRSSGSTFPIGTTTVTCSATDSGGLSGSASFTVTVRDTTPPAFGTFAGTVSAYATSTRGAIVRYTAPAAADAVAGPRPVTCRPPSGSQFAVGKTTVTCTTIDTSGNPNTATFTVWVMYQAPTDGAFFLSPIRANGSSIFSIGRALPVKFKLTGASAGITNLAAKLVVTKLSNSIRGTVNDVGDEDGEDTDFLFKYRPAKKLYGYRWKTRSETQGTYQLRVDLGDGVAHQVNVSLRAAK